MYNVVVVFCILLNLSLSCSENFVLIGPERITCYDGKWNGEVPECAPLELCERVHSGKKGVKEVFYKNLYVTIGKFSYISK